MGYASDSISGPSLTIPTFSFSRLLNRHGRLPKEEECPLQLQPRFLQVFPSLVWPIWIVPTRLDISSSRICQFAMKGNTGFVLPCMRRLKRRFTHSHRTRWSQGNGPRIGWMSNPKHSPFSQPRSFLDWPRAPLCRGL